FRRVLFRSFCLRKTEEATCINQSINQSINSILYSASLNTRSRFTESSSHSYQGWINERAYRAQAQGAPRPEPLREVAVMYLLFVVEKGVFYSFANGFNSVYLCCVRKSLITATVIMHDFFGAAKDTLCYIFPQNGKPFFVMVFISFRGKSSVAIYNKKICLSYIHYRNY